MIKGLTVQGVFAENTYFYIDPISNAGFLIDPGAQAGVIYDVFVRNGWHIEKISIVGSFFSNFCG